MIYKRYQIFTRNGLEWSNWFRYDGATGELWQMKGKQRNEYRETERNEPPSPTLEPHQ